MNDRFRFVCILFKGRFISQSSISQGKFKDKFQENMEAFAAACGRFTPYVAVRHSEAVFLDRKGCENLCSPQSLFLRLQGLSNRFFIDLPQMNLSIAFAEDAPTALAKARSGSQNVFDPAFSRETLSLEALFDYASPFVLDFDLHKKMRDRISILKSLGMKNLGDFLKTPLSSIASRFGKEGLELFLKVQGRSHELKVAWPNFIPPVKILEKVDLMDEVFELEPLLFVLKTLVDRSMARLKGLGKRASVIEVRLKSSWISRVSDTLQFRKWKIELAFPQGSSVGLIPLLRDRLNLSLQRQPLEGPVDGMEFEVLETVPSQGSQRDFFCRKEEESENWKTWLSRLIERLGRDSVFMALPVDRYLPEKSWKKKQIPEWESSIQAKKKLRSFELRKEDKGRSESSWVHRPLRLLKKAERLEREGNILYFKESTGAVNSSVKQWMIAEWYGPERISAEWWEQWGSTEWAIGRDYYRIVAQGGEQLWVFVERKEASFMFSQENSPLESHLKKVLYLHGLFD